jgi:type VI protein secretion system component VasK
VPSAAGGTTADAAQAFAALVDAVRAAIPRELAQQLAEFVRELLLALRALIDWCLERLQARRNATFEVEEIPID